jgi:hypothetical protein
MFRGIEPVRHGLDRCGSGITGPARLIDLGSREITPFMVEKPYIQALAVQYGSAGLGLHCLLETQRY